MSSSVGRRIRHSPTVISACPSTATTRPYRGGIARMAAQLAPSPLRTCLTVLGPPHQAVQLGNLIELVRPGERRRSRFLAEPSTPNASPGSRSRTPPAAGTAPPPWLAAGSPAQAGRWPYSPTGAPLAASSSAAEEWRPIGTSSASGFHCAISAYSTMMSKPIIRSDQSG